MKQAFFLSLSFLIIYIFSGCKKEEPASILTISTIAVTNITGVSMTSGGIITSDDGAVVSERGVCWSKNIRPTINDDKTSDGAGEGSFSSSINNLDEATKYYVRAFATTSVVTSYGNQVSFITNRLSIPSIFNPNLTYRSVSDIDGNNYKTIQIGRQTWMAENLKSIKYNDNTPISNITDNSEWANLSTDAYCWYFNDIATYKSVYGGLYNWYAVNTGKLCPTGWHVPSEVEWHTLVLNIDSNAQNVFGTESSIAGGKLKEAGTAHWESPNNGATNKSGFTAIPGGLRNSVGAYSQEQITDYAFFWSTTESDPANAYSRMIGYDATNIYRKSSNKLVGMAIRCVKD